MQKALKTESVWVAGVAIGMPSAYYLAAIAAILNAGPRAASAIAALIVFTVIAFLLTEIFLVSFLRAPEATRQRVDEIYLWSRNHHRLLVAGTAAIVGVYLLILGTSKL